MMTQIDSRRVQFRQFMQSAQAQGPINDQHHVKGGKLLSHWAWTILYWVPVISYFFVQPHFIAVSKRTWTEMNKKAEDLTGQKPDKKVPLGESSLPVVHPTRSRTASVAESSKSDRGPGPAADEENEKERPVTPSTVGSDHESVDPALQEAATAENESKGEEDGKDVVVADPKKDEETSLEQPLSEVVEEAVVVVEAPKQPPTLEERILAMAPYAQRYCLRANVGIKSEDITAFPGMLKMLFPLLGDHPVVGLVVEPLLANTVESAAYKCLSPEETFTEALRLFRGEVEAAKSTENAMRERISKFKKAVLEARTLAARFEGYKKKLPSEQKKKKDEELMYLFADQEKVDSLLARHLFMYMHETVTKASWLDTWYVKTAAQALSGKIQGLLSGFINNAVLNVIKLASHAKGINTKDDQNIKKERHRLATILATFLPTFIWNNYESILDEVRYLQYVDGIVQGKETDLKGFYDQTAKFLEAAAKQAELFQGAFVKMIAEQRAELAKNSAL